MPCVTSGGEISDLIVTQPEVLSFKLWSLLLFGIDSKYNYYLFVGHCGAFCGLKWRIWRAKMYFSPLK